MPNNRNNAPMNSSFEWITEITSGEWEVAAVLPEKLICTEHLSITMSAASSL
jgi:hypothetical protein